VRLLNDDGEPVGDEFKNALWGIESNAGDYLQEVAVELAEDICHKMDTAAAAEAKEQATRDYWASRDVMTVGV
jgi:hypothetical protein